MMKIGVQLYSVRDEMERDFEGTLKRVKDMGYDCVEFAGLFGRSAAEVKALCDYERDRAEACQQHGCRYAGDQRDMSFHNDLRKMKGTALPETTAARLMTSIRMTAGGMSHAASERSMRFRMAEGILKKAARAAMIRMILDKIYLNVRPLTTECTFPNIIAQ